MKTALCISGQTRFGSYAFRALAHNLLRGLDCDVFLFLWLQKGQTEDDARAVAQSYIGQYANIRACAVSEQIDFPLKDYETNIHPGSNVFNIQSMYYAIKMANQLKMEHEKNSGQKYDCVIRTRCDESSLQAMDMAKYRPLLGNYFFVPEVSYYRDGLNDTFAFSSSENMDVAATLFDRFDEYFYQDKVMFNPHVMLKHHLQKNRIPIAFLSIAAEFVREVTIPRRLEG